MYTIGVIDLSESQEETNEYIKNLCKKNFKATMINESDIMDGQDQADIFLIKDDEATQNISKICELIIEIRNNSDAFIWVCQKSQDKVSRLVYLQLGVDGNIDKNCPAEELELVLLNAMKRKNKEQEEDEQLTESKEEKKLFELNEANMSVLIDKKEIELTKREFCMIHLLSSNPKTAFSYEEIYQSVWNGVYDNQKYKVANVIFRLREKIEKNTDKPLYIRTVRSRGYMLDV